MDPQDGIGVDVSVSSENGAKQLAVRNDATSPTSHEFQKVVLRRRQVDLLTGPSYHASIQVYLNLTIGGSHDGLPDAVPSVDRRIRLRILANSSGALNGLEM